MEEASFDFMMMIKGPLPVLKVVLLVDVGPISLRDVCFGFGGSVFKSDDANRQKTNEVHGV